VLDPAAGHGTFIAGIFANLAPGSKVHCERALSSYGDTDDAAVATTLLAMFPDDGSKEPPFDIVTMSFGGYCDDDDPPIAIASAIATIQARYNTVDPDSNEIIRDRVVFVASAGNDATCRPTWPASFENVIGVGALGPNGPAWFTNFGPWVNACAPGRRRRQHVLRPRPRGEGRRRGLRRLGQVERHLVLGPIVAATIAWEWMCRGNAGSPGEVAAWVLDRPGHFRYPGLGTVVNVP
jgi:hypothetical protein